MNKNIRVWFSSEEGERYRLSEQSELRFSDSVSGGLPVIKIDPETKYQSILGMGASLEEASIYNLSRMSGDRADVILKSLIHPEAGIGWNLMRICFGSSDFTAQEYYSYDDMPPGETDLELKHFSIQKDIDYGLVAAIKKVLAINPKMKIFASPWSPPGWMKSTGMMCGGYLLPEYYTAAARYFRLAIQAYEALGIPIYAMTLQNEPLMVSKDYPTSKFTWKTQLEFLKVVKGEFVAHDIQTKIWIFDHNFNQALKFPGRILADPEGYSATDGVAFHAYEGKVHQMGQLHEKFPKTDIFFTEYSTWGTQGIEAVLSYFRNWARSYNAWVFCLDDQRQPNAGPHEADPTFVMIDSQNPDNFWYIPEYYMLGQITKFVQPGAYRIYSDEGPKKKVTNLAFQNSDGSLVLIVVNQTKNSQKFQVTLEGKTFIATIPDKTVATYKWTQ